ncbi:hypothetical protein [Wenzhouxiangella limi]|uniref:Uncharacterized protein n=1 Tax=Wenzhouxiangella limi TaxID=2707351 RepID=A0A845V2U4_9GAMM|nr:hypothetical protein [Wenzhouxiangella limi]NDY94325.1 hypothetical protein [Wenzhouxiangella limi]
MPKILLGCLIVLALVVVGGGTVGYFMVFKPAYEFASDVGSFSTEFAELNEQIAREPRYQPPLEGMLSASQFQRFLAAQRDMRAGMEGRLNELENQWQAVRAEIDRQERDPNIVEMVTAYRDLADLVLEAKRQQVEALQAHEFSLEEYLYVRNTTYRALGEEIAVASFGQQGNPPMARELPDEVLEMVRPHREELMESYVLAWFGL